MSGVPSINGQLGAIINVAIVVSQSSIPIGNEKQLVEMISSKSITNFNSLLITIVMISRKTCDHVPLWRVIVVIGMPALKWENIKSNTDAVIFAHVWNAYFQHSQTNCNCACKSSSWCSNRLWTFGLHTHCHDSLSYQQWILHLGTI